MKKLVFILTSMWFCGITPHEFLIKKNKKGPSLNQLVEQCCESFGRHHPLLSDLIERCAKLQKEEFRLLAAEVEGNSCLRKRSKEQLDNINKTAEQIEQQLTMLNESLRQYTDLIAS